MWCTALWLYIDLGQWCYFTSLLCRRCQRQWQWGLRVLSTTPAHTPVHGMFWPMWIWGRSGWRHIMSCWLQSIRSWCCCFTWDMYRWAWAQTWLRLTWFSNCTAQADAVMQGKAEGQAQTHQTSVKAQAPACLCLTILSLSILCNCIMDRFPSYRLWAAAVMCCKQEFHGSYDIDSPTTFQPDQYSTWQFLDIKQCIVSYL